MMHPLLKTMAKEIVVLPVNNSGSGKILCETAAVQNKT